MCVLRPFFRFLTHGVVIPYNSNQYWFKLFWNDGEEIIEDFVDNLAPGTQVNIYCQRVRALFSELEIGVGQLKVIDIFAHIILFHFSHSHMAPLAGAHPLLFCCFVLGLPPGTKFPNQAPNKQPVTLGTNMANVANNQNQHDSETYLIVVAQKPKEPAQGQKIIVFLFVFFVSLTGSFCLLTAMPPHQSP
jgi:hypothetical protein